jgi:NADH-quinone oxidoreductase subunit L
MTHAFFKALLFLGAGSVIIGMHHEQDMRHMGGLRKYMPITYLDHASSARWPDRCSRASPASSPRTPSSRRWSLSHNPAPATPISACWLGVFVTALYSFRLVFMVFHGKERMDHHTQEHLHESPAVVTVPLMALAVPSVIIGALGIGSMVFGNYFGNSIVVAHEHDVLGHMAEEFHGVVPFITHGVTQLPFMLAMAGAVTAWFLYLQSPGIPAKIASSLSLVHRILLDKYGFDRFNEWFFAGGSRGIGRLLWKVGDEGLIDGLLVNGSARAVGWWASVVRNVQSGFLYHYAFAMIIGLLVLLGVFVHGVLS